MKAERAYPKFIITAKGTKWVEQGHPWIYADEIIREEGNCENGALADAVSEKASTWAPALSAARAKSGCALSPATPTTGSTKPSGSGASATPGTTVKPSWEMTSPAAA